MNSPLHEDMYTQRRPNGNKIKSLISRIITSNRTECARGTKEALEALRPNYVKASHHKRAFDTTIQLPEPVVRLAPGPLFYLYTIYIVSLFTEWRYRSSLTFRFASIGLGPVQTITLHDSKALLVNHCVR